MHEHLSHWPFHRLSVLGLICAGSITCTAAPDEELLGKSQGYPVGQPANWFYDESVRVGSFSHLEQILPHHVLKHPSKPSPLPKTDPPAFHYQFGGKTCSIDDYLDHQRVTGLLIIKNGEIIVERYQYSRRPSDRFVSHSMAKSLVSLAVGLALADGKIKSLDDPVSRYLPDLRGCPYGETRIRNLLRMASGVRFDEVYDGKDDLARYVNLRISQGAIPASRAFTEREAPEGTRFHYASSETYLLGLLIKAATGKSLSGYLEARLWRPLGAESDASWAIDDSGDEWAAGNFSAVLRDYGRLGILLANDGFMGGQQVVPKNYLLEATDWHKHPEAFAPGHATPSFGYGYQFWILPGEKRRFALLGVYGQALFVDPEFKLVMVHTAVAKNANITVETMAAERYALWRGIIGQYGTW